MTAAELARRRGEGSVVIAARSESKTIDDVVNAPSAIEIAPAFMLSRIPHVSCETPVQIGKYLAGTFCGAVSHAIVLQSAKRLEAECYAGWSPGRCGSRFWFGFAIGQEIFGPLICGISRRMP